MQDHKVKVLGKEMLAPGVCRLWLNAPQIAANARPGEFVMTKCGNASDPLLRRPMTVHRFGARALDLDDEGRNSEWVTPDSIALLFYASGPARGWLGDRQVGEEIQVLGPLGRGYEIDPDARHLVMGGSGWWLAPLVALADEAIASGRSVTYLSAGPTASHLYPRELVQPQADYVAVTEDGSAGETGLLPDCLPKFAHHADQVFLSGPTPLYKAVHDAWARLDISTPAQVLLEIRMACGFGICFGCVTWTLNGPRKVCRYGPKFDLQELDWSRL